MSNENQRIFDHDLAAAAQPTEVEDKKVEYANDPAKSLNRGLITLYNKYISDINRQRQAGLIDQEEANELAKSVLSIVERDGLRNEIGFTSTEETLEIMGTESYFGLNEVMKSGIEIREEIPLIPYSIAELERAKELGQMLIYRTSTTMKELNDTFSLWLETHTFNFYQNKDFFKQDKIQPGWALVSKELTPGSTDKNYLEQSEFLAEYLVNEVYQGKPLPGKYQAAIDQLNDQKEMIQPLVNSHDEDDYMPATGMLANLKINQLFRQSSAEVFYDFIVYLQNTGKRLHKNDLVWTSTRSSDEYLVAVGQFDIKSTKVSGFLPRGNMDFLGASFSSRGADLKS